jgi:hypothetical protein
MAIVRPPRHSQKRDGGRRQRQEQRGNGKDDQCGSFERTNPVQQDRRGNRQRCQDRPLPDRAARHVREPPPPYRGDERLDRLRACCVQLPAPWLLGCRLPISDPAPAPSVCLLLLSGLPFEIFVIVEIFVMASS